MPVKILCIATPFGYGPVSKLITVCRRLEGHELVFAGTGVALELAVHERSFQHIVPADLATPEGASIVEDWALRSDLMIASVEPDAVGIATRAGIPCAYIDSLFWMWDRIPEPARTAHWYFAQRFVGVEQRAELMRADMPGLTLVGPIVDARHAGARRRRDLVVVNLSGLESPLYQLGRNLSYHRPVLDCLMAAASAAGLKSELVITGNRRVMEEYEERYGSTGARFAHLSHEEFLKLLAEASLLITSPGLTTTYEALVYGTPIRFLPPQNYSQALMLPIHQAHGVTDLCLDWSVLYQGWGIEAELEESIGVARVLDVIERFGSDPDAQAQATAILTRMLKAPPCDSVEQRERLGITMTDGTGEIVQTLVAAGVLDRAMVS